MYTIYGAEWCSACKQAIKFCEDRDIQYEYVDIDQTDDDIVKSFRSVPQVYFGVEHIGGLKALRDHYSKFV